MKEGMRLQSARLTGIMFHDPEKGTEFYESLVATLNGEDNSDDDWLNNPNASTDLAALEGTIQRRIHERTNTSSSDGPNTDTSSS